MVNIKNVVLKIKSLKLENIEVPNFDEYEMFKINNIETFLSILPNNKVFKYKDKFMDIFFTLKDGKIFYIDANGFKTLYDYIEAKNLGFDAEEYYIFKKYFNDLEEYKKFKNSGFSDVKEYFKAKKLGFIGSYRKLVEEKILEPFDGLYILHYLFKGYRESTIINNDCDVYKFCIKNNFKDFNTFLEAIKNGFGNYDEYIDALKRGFTNAYDYNDALFLGFECAKDYYIAKELGIHSYKEYEEYKELKYLCEIFKLETFEEGYLIKYLLSLNFGDKISLDSLYNHLEEKRNIISLKKKVNNNLFFNTTRPLWYSTKFYSKEVLDKYLEYSLVIKFLGIYEDKIFYKVLTNNPKNMLVLLDLTDFENLENKKIISILENIKEIGFENFLIIVNESIDIDFNLEGFLNVISSIPIRKVFSLLIDNLNLIILTNKNIDAKYTYIIKLSENMDFEKSILKEIYNEISVRRIENLKKMINYEKSS